MPKGVWTVPRPVAKQPKDRYPPAILALKISPADREFWTRLTAAVGSNAAALDWLLERYGTDQLHWVEHVAAVRQAEWRNSGPVLSCPMCHRVNRLRDMVADFESRRDDNPLGLRGCRTCKPRGFRPWYAPSHNSARGSRRSGWTEIKMTIPPRVERVLQHLGLQNRTKAVRDLISYGRQSSGGHVSQHDSLTENLPLPMDLPPAMPRWME